MIQNTEEGKKALKAAKALAKQADENLRLKMLADRKEWDREMERQRIRAKNAILSGVLESEYELSLDCPVNYSYCYVVQTDNGATVVQSNVSGTVNDLVRDLLRKRFDCILKVFNCNLKERNLL